MAYNKAYQKAYRKAHRKEALAYQKEYRKAHKKENSKRSKAYYEANKKAIRAKQKKAYHANREKINSRRKVLNFLNKYGMTFQDLEHLWQRQKKRCPICKRCIPNPCRQRSSKTHVDHCHKTGKVRGLLCCSCNLGLGSLQHSVSNHKRAIKYLQKANHVSKRSS
jgi:hypothetical protein